MKRPSFQFYPADWRKDTALQFCSLSARGLWIEMMCIAHECDSYGFLRINGRPMTAAQIGRLVGISERECMKLLDELFEAGVFSKADDASIYSRRMVRDEKLRERRAEGGKAGSEHGAKGGIHGAKGGRPAKGKTPLGDGGRGVFCADEKPPLKPPPSSSSSSSTSVDISADADIKPARDARFDAQAHLVSLGVEERVASDWLAHRKAKRASSTLTAISAIVAEAAKARIPLSEALSIACQRGWTGFEADWIAKEPQRQPAASIHDQRAATIAALTGRSPNERTVEPRDITADAVRVA